MNKIKLLKIIVIISFLVITPHSSSTLTFPNGLWILIGVTIGILDFIWSLFLEKFSFLGFIKDFSEVALGILTFVSIYFVSTTKKTYIALSLIVQYLFIFYTSDIKSLQSLWFTIPAAIYVISSLMLLYFIFLKQKTENKHLQL